MIVTSSAFAQFDRQNNEPKKFNKSHIQYNNWGSENQQKNDQNTTKQIDYNCLNDCQRMNYSRQLCVSKCSY